MENKSKPSTLIESRDRIEMTAWNKLRADTWRIFGQFRLRDLFAGVLLFRRTFRPVVTMRLCQMASHSRWGRLFLPVMKPAHRLATQLSGIDLAWHTEVGPCFKIKHGCGLVVSPSAKTGADMTLFHGVTLGSRDRIGPEGRRDIHYPIIEDEAWIGPHAIVVGGGSRIAVRAFMPDSVAQHSVVGNPAVVINTGCMPDISTLAPLSEY